MMIRRLSVAAALAVTAFAAGCASTVPTMDASRPASKALQASVLKGVAQPTVVANGHVIDSQVVQSLLSGFSEQASKAGVKVQPDGAPITITVQEYSARPVAARWLAGALAGSDHIKAAVALGETTFVIEDTARSIATGINGVAKNVGVQAANGVAAVAGLAQPN